MDLSAFRETLVQPAPTEGLSLALQALWWDAKGDWHKAHECAQEQDDQSGAHVHAYLHRKEGDLSNADYWYRRAGTKAFKGSHSAEWEELARSFLNR